MHDLEVARLVAQVETEGPKLEKVDARLVVIDGYLLQK